MSDLLPALQITVIGMGSVFTAILLLWLMMILLTRFTGERRPSTRTVADPDSLSIHAPRSHEEDLLARAAVVAVAMALAQQERSSAHPLQDPPTAIVSAWQLGMRMRQMSEKGTFRRPDKV
jgi:Na+-transporting methylmalonyl-CoA/oxaloacetate decarboxylase gamma subunit